MPEARDLRIEKTPIEISGVKEITETRVLIILKDNTEIWLPRSQAERFKNQVFIPTWLANKMGIA